MLKITMDILRIIEPLKKKRLVSCTKEEIDAAVCAIIARADPSGKGIERRVVIGVMEAFATMQFSSVREVARLVLEDVPRTAFERANQRELALAAICYAGFGMAGGCPVPTDIRALIPEGNGLIAQAKERMKISNPIAGDGIPLTGTDWKKPITSRGEVRPQKVALKYK